MKRTLPPLNAIRAFEAAARLGGVGKAAEELNVTHGAVSHQIKALEAWVGCPLFRKSGRNVEVNSAGAALLPVAGTALNTLAERLSEIRESGAASTLTISAAPSIAYRWIVPRLHGFAARYPSVDVRLNHSSQVTDFTREDIDVAVRFGRGGWREVEEIRLLAKANRQSVEDDTEEPGDHKKLISLLTTLNDDKLIDIARAFNQFLNLTNIAEQAESTESGTESQLEELFQRLLDQGVGKHQVSDSIQIGLHAEVLMIVA